MHQLSTIESKWIRWKEELDHHHHHHHHDVYATKCGNFGSRAWNPCTNPLLPLLHTIALENNCKPKQQSQRKKIFNLKPQTSQKEHINV
jgi:hypothetical protein